MGAETEPISTTTVNGTDANDVDPKKPTILSPPNGIALTEVADPKPAPTVADSEPAPPFDIDEVLAKMDIADKITLLSGKDGWHTRDVPSFNISSMRLSDGKRHDIIILQISNFIIYRTQRCPRHSMYTSNFLLILPDTNNEPNL